MEMVSICARMLYTFSIKLFNTIVYCVIFSARQTEKMDQPNTAFCTNNTSSWHFDTFLIFFFFSSAKRRTNTCSAFHALASLLANVIFLCYCCCCRCRCRSCCYFFRRSECVWNVNEYERMQTIACVICMFHYMDSCIHMQCTTF